MCGFLSSSSRGDSRRQCQRSFLLSNYCRSPPRRDVGAAQQILVTLALLSTADTLADPATPPPPGPTAAAASESVECCSPLGPPTRRRTGRLPGPTAAAAAAITVVARHDSESKPEPPPAPARARVRQRLLWKSSSRRMFCLPGLCHRAVAASHAEAAGPAGVATCDLDGCHGPGPIISVELLRAEASKSRD